MTKIITVFGATGNQGGSVVKHILAHPGLSKSYRIRAITRDATKPAALDLMDMGCDIVSVIWESLSAEVEKQQGKNIADASKASNVSHLIWSSLPNVSKETNGELTGVKHFDSKASVEEYICAQGIPATFIMTGGFMSSQLQSLRPSSDTPPIFTAAIPFSPVDTRIPLHAAEDDTGLFVSAALINGPEGKRVAAASAEYTLQQVAEGYESVTGHKTQVVQVSYEVFESFLPAPVKAELSANMLLMEKYGYYVGEGDDVLEQSLRYLKRAGVRNPITWEQYVRLHVKQDVTSPEQNH